MGVKYKVRVMSIYKVFTYKYEYKYFKILKYKYEYSWLQVWYIKIYQLYEYKYKYDICVSLVNVCQFTIHCLVTKRYRCTTVITRKL